jgi:cellulose synthase/poly-beta-1,6-N-acetylglucosamine synthase-like glycosyltransferase
MISMISLLFVQALFWISAGFIVYTYLGYPLLLRALAYRAPRREDFFNRQGGIPSDGALHEPEVVIVIVAHNEAARIQSKIDSCLAQDYPPSRLRLLIVSDGSTDEMVNIVSALDDHRVSLLQFAQRRGKAACLNDAVLSVHESVIVMNDARQMLHPQAVRNLARRFCDPQVGAVSGELVFRLDDATAFGEGVDAYWRYEKAIRRLEGRIDSVVGVTGAIYALRRSLYQPIPPETVLDDGGRRVLCWLHADPSAARPTLEACA